MVKEACDDGGCFYRCMAMSERIARGSEPHDDDEASWAMGERVVKHMEAVVEKASSEDPLFLEDQVQHVQHEMLDDPLWMQTREGPWSWKEYFAWARMPWTFATFCNISAYVEMTGRGIDIFEKEMASHQASNLEWVRLGGMVRCQQVASKTGCGNVQLRRSGKHYDLIVNAIAVAGAGPAPVVHPKKRPAAQTSAKAKATLKRPASACVKKGKLAKSTIAKAKKRTAEEKAGSIPSEKATKPSSIWALPPHGMPCSAEGHSSTWFGPAVDRLPTFQCQVMRRAHQECPSRGRGIAPREDGQESAAGVKRQLSASGIVLFARPHGLLTFHIVGKTLSWRSEMKRTFCDHQFRLSVCEKSGGPGPTQGTCRVEAFCI